MILVISVVIIVFLFFGQPNQPIDETNLPNNQSAWLPAGCFDLELSRSHLWHGPEVSNSQKKKNGYLLQGGEIA